MKPETEYAGTELASEGRKPAPETARHGVAASRNSRNAKDADIASRVGLLIFLVLLIVAFSVLLPSSFPTSANLKSVLIGEAVPVILAIGVIFPLSAGEFDLSIGATLGFSAVFAAWLSIHGVALGPIIVICLCVGACVGVVNALLVAFGGMNAFIATLATGTILSGGNLLFTAGATLSDGIQERFGSYAGRDILGLPMVVYFALAVVVIVWYVLEHVPFGRYLRATGLGREAARLSGIPTRRYLSISFVVAGIVSALAGTLQLGLDGSASPTTGPDFLLPAYAAAFLGATTFHPGRFNAWGTVVGAFVLGVGITGLSMAGAPVWVSPVFNGAPLILGVGSAVLLSHRRKQIKEPPGA